MQLYVSNIIFPILFTLALSLNLSSDHLSVLESLDGRITSASRAPRIHCNGDQYQYNLHRRSCINAYLAIPNDTTRVQIGTRGGPVHWKYNLPYRWISGMFTSSSSYSSLSRE